ncbi:MAG TPA: hypothetical protein QGH10_07545, partial [Armatimonadota bacterium]|nr:hypothetical protein [Armatimonadota bacterium]
MDMTFGADLPCLAGCLLGIVWLGIVALSASGADPMDGLVGHWRLQGDCKDYSGHGNHATAHGADLRASGRDGAAGAAAAFDGIDDFMDVPHSDSLGLGAGDLSISVWVRTDEVLDDVIGDILSKYDPELRRGLNFSVKHHAGMSSSTSNCRNLHFGIDNAQIDPYWIDCGRPGNAIFITAMAVYADNLYVGTFETHADETGHVFRYQGGDQWEDCGSPDNSNSVFCMAEYRGKLYAGTARYRAQGSALPESTNQNPGGRVYRYEGGQTWVDCGRLPEANEVYAMVVYRDELYAIPMYSAGVFRYDGEQSWEFCGIPGDQPSMALAVYNGSLYQAGNFSAGVWRYEGGEDWTFCGKQAQESQTYGFAIYGGDLYVSTWPHGSVFRYGGGEE